jgi:hypothetical protein
MTQTINFQFTPNRADYINGMRAYFTHSWCIWIAFALFGLMFAYGICIFVFLESKYMAWLLILFSLLFTYLLILMPMRLGRQVQKNERLRSEVFWQVDDEHDFIKNKFAETKFDWGTFQSCGNQTLLSIHLFREQAGVPDCSQASVRIIGARNCIP